MKIKSSHKRQVLDITDDITTGLPSGRGVLTVFTQHTTAAVTIADLDPGTDKDFIDFLQSLVPEINWRHPHDPAHAPDHLLASLLGPSITIPYKDGHLQLGTWQRVILVEFDGPRERSVLVVH